MANRSSESRRSDCPFQEIPEMHGKRKPLPNEADGKLHWLKINVQTFLLIAVLAGGWIANFATLSARMADTEKVEGKLEQRFDRDVVPRQEQEVRERMLDQRLEQMQRSLDAIQQELRRQRR
jgi:hypothetical protein